MLIYRMCVRIAQSVEQLYVQGGASAHCVCYSFTWISWPVLRLVCRKVCVLLCACCLLVQDSETEPGTEEPGELDCVSLGGYLALWNRHSSLSRCQRSSWGQSLLIIKKSQFPRARRSWSFQADELPRITFHSLAGQKPRQICDSQDKHCYMELLKYHRLWWTQTGKWKWLGECARWKQSRQFAALNVNFVVWTKQIFSNNSGGCISDVLWLRSPHCTAS